MTKVGDLVNCRINHPEWILTLDESVAFNCSTWVVWWSDWHAIVNFRHRKTAERTLFNAGYKPHATNSKCWVPEHD